MPICGTRIDPSPDTNTPETPVSDDLLTPRDFGIPPRSRYQLADLAPYLCRDTPEADAAERRRAVKTAMKTLERECERGALRGVRVGRVIWIPAAELTRYFLANNTLVCEN